MCAGGGAHILILVWITAGPDDDDVPLVMIDLDDEDPPPATIPAGGSSSASKHGDHDWSAGGSAMWDRIADGADTGVKTLGAARRTIRDVL